MPRPTNGLAYDPSHGSFARESYSENGRLTANAPGHGSSSNDTDRPTPSLTSDRSTCSRGSHENTSDVTIPRPGQTSPSAEHETVFQERYIITPKPARPDSDPAKCLPHPQHDPFMGSGCLGGFGERAKPFPFLHGQPVAEKPPDARLKHVIGVWGLGRTVSDTSRIGARTGVESISGLTGGRSEKGSEGALNTNAVGHLPPPVNPHQRAGYVPEYARCDELPSSVALAHLSSEAAGRELDPRTPLFPNDSDEHSIRVLAIHNKVSECDTVKHKEMFQLDPQTAEPGPQVNFNSLRAIAATPDQLPKAFQNLILRLHQVRHRYFVAWDILLTLSRELRDLVAERQQLNTLTDEIIANPNSDDGKRRAYIAWRVAQNSENFRQKAEQYRTCQTGVASCANTLLHDKTKTADILADPRGAYMTWMRNLKARTGSAQPSCSSNGSSSASGRKRARKNDEQQQGNVESARKRLCN